jgi:hypothetical protein
MRWESLFLAGFAIAAFACGGKVAPGTSIANVDACTLPNACSLISSSQVSQAMGTAFSPGAAQTVDGAEDPVCTFSDASGMAQSVVSVDLDCPHQTADVYRAQFAQQTQIGGVSVSGIGDDAIWIPGSNVLAVLSGQNAFAVAIEFSSQPVDDAQSQATAIAQDVIANL